MIPRELTDILSSDPDILGGTVCFTATRIPVKILFDHINYGVSLEEFLEDFPSVNRGMALRVMAWEKKVALTVLEAV